MGDYARLNTGQKQMLGLNEPFKSFETYETANRMMSAAWEAVFFLVASIHTADVPPRPFTMERLHANIDAGRVCLRLEARRIVLFSVHPMGGDAQYKQPRKQCFESLGRACPSLFFALAGLFLWVQNTKGGLSALPWDFSPCLLGLLLL